MPIELGIWKLTGTDLKPQRVAFSTPELEKHLEETIAHDLSIVDATPLLLIGRQVAAWGGSVSSKFIDLLCIDAEGNLVVMELKRAKTPREVVTQTLDYGAWMTTLSLDDIRAIFAEKNNGKPFEAAFEEAFGPSSLESLQSLGNSPRLIIVAAELDRETERILSFLTRAYQVPINAVLFNYFRDGDNSFLSRTWLLDPYDEEATSPSPRSKNSGEVWNKRDFYVNLGDKTPRDWDDCRQFGFISAGGKTWYSRSLKQLKVGARVFVYLAGEAATHKGYVGVGVVSQEVVPYSEAKVELNGQMELLSSLPLVSDGMDHNADDEALKEYVVGIKWLKTVPREEAYREKGFFAQQNTVCQFKNVFTLDKLVAHFHLGDDDSSSTPPVLSNP